MAKARKSGSTASNRSIAGSVFEGIKGIGSQTAQSAMGEFSAMAQDGVKSLAGIPRSNNLPNPNGSPDNLDGEIDGAMMPPEHMRPPGLGRRKEKPRDVEIFSHAERRETIETSEQIKKLVIMIKDEVKKIEVQNKMMITETAKIAVEQLPDKPGVYHVRFFEWLLNTLRDIRKKVSESASWLSIARGKQKKGYWGMAKKKGTSYTLSGERTPATQTG